MEKEINNLKDILKLHLQSVGWQTDHAEIVVDGIVESFGGDFSPEDIATYNELARNQGVAEPLEFDDNTVSILNQIKNLLK